MGALLQGCLIWQVIELVREMRSELAEIVIDNGAEFGATRLAAPHSLTGYLKVGVVRWAEVGVVL